MNCDLLSKTTHLDRHTPKKSLGCLLDYSLDCLGHLTRMAATPIYGKTKFVQLKAVVDLDLF